MKLVAKGRRSGVAPELPEWGGAEAINYLKDRVKGHGGMSCSCSADAWAVPHNTPRMAWAIKTSQHESTERRKELIFRFPVGSKLVLSAN